VRAAVRRTAKIVSHEEVAAAWGKGDLKSLHPHFLDRQYAALPVETWEKILLWSRVDSPRYVSERRDCDDFAMALRGELPLKCQANGIGVVLDWSGGHAYNAILIRRDDDTIEVGAIEPQSDRLIKTGSGMYPASCGAVFF